MHRFANALIYATLILILGWGAATIVGAEGKDRLKLTAEVAACDEYELTVKPVDLAEGPSYRIVFEKDPAPFGTYVKVSTTDIGDSEDSVLLETGSLPVDARFRASLEIFIGDEWVPANAGGSNPEATLVYKQAGFCPTATPTSVPATPTPVATAAPPTPQVIIVEVPVIQPPSTGSAGLLQ